MTRSNYTAANNVKAAESVSVVGQFYIQWDK